MSAPIHNDDKLHVILDALGLARDEINHDKWCPWDDYDGPEEEDRKASRAGYLDVIERAWLDITRKLDVGEVL